MWGQGFKAEGLWLRAQGSGLRAIGSGLQRRNLCSCSYKSFGWEVNVKKACADWLLNLVKDCSSGDPGLRA